MPEVLPTSAAAYDVAIEKVIMPNESETETITETGTVAAIATRLAYYKAAAVGLTSDIASIAYRSANGRAAITVAYDRVDDDIRRLGVQEFYAVDVVRDIKAAPYFASLTNAQTSAVQSNWDARLGPVTEWTDLQKSLYGHMAHGQESYIETAYEFRQTYQTTSNKKIKAATSNPNTVQDLPALTRTLENLVDAVPAGEWLKKPTTVQYAGRKGWTVSLTYQWAPKWSVIYGGTFTGLDA